MTMKADATLMLDARLRCGGGMNHLQTQVLHAYEMAVALYNDPRTKMADKADIRKEIEELESKLYQMGRKK